MLGRCYLKKHIADGDEAISLHFVDAGKRVEFSSFF
jgi:hypothetical protein